MSPKLYQVECDAECGFLIRNHNKAELVPVVITHCINTHNDPTTEKAVAGMIRVV